MYDIDESGEKELLVGSRSNGGDERVVGVYCFDGVDAKNMFEDQTLAERSLLQIYENGTMYIYGSGGASYGNASFYRMDGEHTVIQTEQYTFDMEDIQNSHIITTRKLCQRKHSRKNWTVWERRYQG